MAEKRSTKREDQENSSELVVGVPKSGVRAFGLEHIEGVETERFDLEEPALENRMGDFLGRIGGFYLVLPKEGYSANPTMREAHESRVYVDNHFELGLFGEIVLLHKDRVVSALPDTRLAHILYACDEPRIDLAYSTDCRSPDGGGAEYNALVTQLPDELIGERQRLKVTLVGDVSIHMLFAKMRQQVRDLAYKHLKWKEESSEET